MSNKSKVAFSRMAASFSRRFGWVCAGTLAAIGMTPPANTAAARTLSDQSVQVNSIQARLRSIREGLTTEMPRKAERNEHVLRFTQWYNGR